MWYSLNGTIIRQGPRARVVASSTTDVWPSLRKFQHAHFHHLATMKLSWSFIVSSLYCAASATQEGHVYILDPVSRTLPQVATTVDAATARLILAQRLGLSRFHSIDRSRSEESLKQINAYGGRQQKLFGGDDADRTHAHALVWIEGVEDADGTHVACLAISTS